MTLRELAQLYVGNELLCFSLLAFIELIHVDGFAIIETALKEYSPALCKSFASAMFQAITETPVEPVCKEPSEEELVMYRSMVINDLGDVAGADFAGYTPHWR